MTSCIFPEFYHVSNTQYDYQLLLVQQSLSCLNLCIKCRNCAQRPNTSANRPHRDSFFGTKGRLSSGREYIYSPSHYSVHARNRMLKIDGAQNVTEPSLPPTSAPCTPGVSYPSSTSTRIRSLRQRARPHRALAPGAFARSRAPWLGSKP